MRSGEGNPTYEVPNLQSGFGANVVKLLLPHQRTAYKHIRDQDHMALFMEPRTGKTLPSIRWAKRHVEDGCVLIVAPLSVLRNWQNELHDDGVHAEILEGSSELKLDHLVCSMAFGCRWFLVNPGGLRAEPRIATTVSWQVVMVDEATCIRNPKATLTKMFLKLFKAVPHRAILTGLANPEGPEDFVTQMIFTFGQFMGCTKYWDWRMRYMKPSYFGWEVPDRLRPAIKAAVAEEAFILTAASAGLFLPKVYQTREVALPPQVARLYESVREDWEGGGAETVYSVKKETWLAQLASGVIPADFDEAGKFIPHKAKEVANIITTELGKEQVIVWSRFTPENTGIAAELRKTTSVGVINGATKPVDREKIRDKFLAGKFQVVICQPKVAAMGLDFSSASVAIFTSNYWDLETRAQCLERTNHPLKDRTKPTLILDIVSKDTVDGVVAEALKNKWKSARYFLRHVRTKLRKPNGN